MDAMNLEQVDGMEYIIDTVYIERKRNIVIPGIQSAMFIHLSFKNIPHTRGIMNLDLHFIGLLNQYKRKVVTVF